MLGIPETLSNMTLPQVIADKRIGCMSVILSILLLYLLGGSLTEKAAAIKRFPFYLVLQTRIHVARLRPEPRNDIEPQISQPGLGPEPKE